MINDLSVSARKLKEASSLLNELTDKANESIQMAEDFLSKSCSVGASSLVSIKIENKGLLDIDDYYLVYRKINNKYRLAITTKDTVLKRGGRIQTPTLKPASDCSRDLKLAAIVLLPEFLDEITRQITNQIDSAEIITETVYETMCELTGQEA